MCSLSTYVNNNVLKEYIMCNMKLRKPTPTEIYSARIAAGLTQTQAAAVVGKTRYQTWLEWENGKKPMPWMIFELFCMKTGQQLPEQNQESRPQAGSR